MKMFDHLSIAKSGYIASSMAIVLLFFGWVGVSSCCNGSYLACIQFTRDGDCAACNQGGASTEGSILKTTFRLSVGNKLVVRSSQEYADNPFSICVDVDRDARPSINAFMVRVCKDEAGNVYLSECKSGDNARMPKECNKNSRFVPVVLYCNCEFLYNAGPGGL